VAAGEDGPALRPPGGGAPGQLRQPALRQPEVLLDVRLNDWLFPRRQQFFDWRLLGADELGKEAALGEELVDQDRADRVGLLVRLEVEQVVRHRPPHARRLVRFAGVGGQDMLENRLNGLRHVGVGDGGKS
jgi:hypothetical protein